MKLNPGKISYNTKLDPSIILKGHVTLEQASLQFKTNESMKSSQQHTKRSITQASPRREVCMNNFEQEKLNSGKG